MPRIASGEWTAAFALTEPNAGSDAGSIETAAVLDGARITQKEIIAEELVNRLTSGENIVKIAVDKKIDLILIGVRFRSKVGKLLFGSTAQFVILKAPCPVLTVK